MKIGLNIMPVPAAELAEIGQRAEELGFEGIYFGEHIGVPIHLKTPYPGKLNYHGAVTQLECFVALGHLAAVTKKVRLATGVTILPLRHPLQTARAITTVDNISGGRFDLIVGVGSIPDEYEVMGVDYKTRGAKMDEWLDILDKLWTEDEVSFDGRFMSFQPMGFEPKPIQKPGPPLYMGGRSKLGLDRAARRADGWYGDVDSPAKVLEIKQTLEPLLQKYGRDLDTFKYKVIHYAGVAVLPSMEELQGYADAGVESVTVSPFELEEKDAVNKLEAAGTALKKYLL